MFGKLCKYEFKSIVRTLVPIYLAVIAISILNAFMGMGSLFNGYYDGLMFGLSFGHGLLNLIQIISVSAYFGLLVALSVLTLIIVIQRFYKGLLCDEGYLMFTLPVKPWQLIAAKGLVAFVMSMASFLTALVSIFILILGTAGPSKVFTALANPEIWTAVNQGISLVPSWPLLVFELIILTIVGGLVNLYHIYFSMALGHLTNRHRILMSVVAFIGISLFFSFINGLAMIIMGNIPYFKSLFNIIDTMPDAQGIVFVMHLIFIGSVVYNAILLAIFFFGTERILSKRLNLE